MLTVLLLRCFLTLAWWREGWKVLGTHKGALDISRHKFTPFSNTDDSCCFTRSGIITATDHAF